MSIDIENISKVWIELCGFKQGSAEYESRFWAWEELNDATSESPEIAWTIICEILKKTDSDQVIGNLAAGPLEDMMRYHDRFTMEKIKNEIQGNPKLKKCMADVWLDSNDTNLYKKFYKLAGIPPVFDEVNDR